MTLSISQKHTLLATLFFCISALTQAQVEATNDEAQAAEVSVNVYASRDNHGWGAVYMSREDVGKDQGHIVDYDLIEPYEADAEVEKWQQIFGQDNAYQARDGKSIYHRSCAACHLHQGQGGFSAGYYPPLADNPKMSSEDYIYSIMINGFRGMPYFREMLDDEQMVEVVRYIQQELNDYHHELNAEDVAALRHENPPEFDPSDG